MAALDLRVHEAVVERSGGAVEWAPLSPDRPVAEVTREVLAAVGQDGRGGANQPLDPQGTHPLTEPLLADFLLVDVSKPYGENTYLEIEQAAREGRAHETCGGRSLNDDVMDTLFTLLVNAGNGPPISDGVDGATKPASQTFPYLTPPNPTPPSPPGHH